MATETYSELGWLVPDGWQPDFLEDMRSVVAGPFTRGYPPREQRLVLRPDELKYTPDGRLILPSDGSKPYHLAPDTGTYDSLDHPRPTRAFYDQGQSLNPDTARERWPGQVFDNRSFPLHPQAEAMLTDPAIGVVTSTGHYWNLGQNETLDAAIFAPKETPEGALCLHALIVRRRDNDQYGVPGGHRKRGEAGEPDEDTAVGTAREVDEETKFKVDSAELEQIMENTGPDGTILVADPRLTAHAWPLTRLFYKAYDEMPSQPIEGRDDAKEALWLPVTRKLVRGAFGSHGQLLMRGVVKYEAENGVRLLSNGMMLPIEGSGIFSH